MNEIKYSNNWNKKLDCDVFTTIRISNDKYQVGSEYSVNLRNREYKRVTIIGKKTILMSDINDWIAGLDAGMGAEEFKRFLKKMYHGKNLNWETQKLDFILQKTIK